jgi:hypothetical protein
MLTRQGRDFTADDLGDENIIDEDEIMVEDDEFGRYLDEFGSISDKRSLMGAYSVVSSYDIFPFHWRRSKVGRLS